MRLDYLEDFSPILTPIQDDLNEWFYLHGMTLEQEERQELINMIFAYKTMCSIKDTKTYVRNKLGKTYKEREAKVMKYADKLATELLKHPTDKGNTLIDSLIDLMANTEEYLHSPKHMSVTQDSIRAYLNELGINLEGKQDLFIIL